MLALCLVLSCFRVSLLEPNTPLYIDEPALSQRDNGYFTTTVQGRLSEDMPEFSFDIEACSAIKSGLLRSGMRREFCRSSLCRS